MKERPIGVTILAILAGIVAVIAAFHTLQFLGILPWIRVGPFAVRDFNLWGTLMYGLLTWVYIWLVQMLWRVDPSAWLFLIIITIFNLILAFVSMISVDFEWGDFGWEVFINGLILIYCMLPGVRRAFGTESD